jgi:hypothetical protein
MKRIVPIPKRLLCRRCKRGRLRSSDADRDQIQLGEYERRCQMTCPKCGYSKSMLETFVGIEEDDHSSNPQISLFE